MGFPNRVLRTRFHRVVLNDWGTACACFWPPLAVTSKPPAMRVIVGSGSHYINRRKTIILGFTNRIMLAVEIVIKE